MAMSAVTTAVEKAREPVLSPIDRISETLFGLLMALSFVGAVSVAETGRAEIRAMFTPPWAAISPGALSTR